MEGKRMAETPKSTNRGKFIVLGLLGVILAAYLLLCAWVTASGKVLPNTTVVGIDLSRKTESQARELLEPVLDLASRPDSAQVVELQYKEYRADLGGWCFQADLDATVALALNTDRESFFTNGYHYISRLLGESCSIGAAGIALTDGGAEQLEKHLQEADHVAGIQIGQNNYELDQNQATLTMVKGVTHAMVDRETTRVAVLRACGDWLQGDSAVVQLEVVETPPRTPDFDGIWRELYAEVAEPAYDKETGAVSHHVVGVDFDVEELKAAYETAGEGETFSIPLTVTQPKDTKESFEKKLFADVLGSGKSQVTGTANRKTNVKLSAEACNGIILLPGEIFSYNNTTGSRTADKGYLPAPTYNAGASVDDVGGGICQTSSTIYYALLHTPLNIVERQNHSYATGYVPDGMDATVFFGSLDFRFENSTNYPLKIVTESYDQNGKRYLKVDLLGTNEDGRYAKPTNYVFEVVQPTNTYVADSSVPQGTLVLDQKQNSYRGRKAKVVRTIYAADGTVVEEQDLGVSRYKMRPNVYHYNPLDGDPAAWPDGQPPKPQPVAPVAPVTPETPVTPVVPEGPVIPNPTIPVDPVVPNGAVTPAGESPAVENTQPPVSP